MTVTKLRFYRFISIMAVMKMSGATEEREI
jgi:hypothetical protein